MSVAISVIVITKNEERNIAECLDSVRWADDIIIVDAASSDRTVEIARAYTDKVFIEEWLGFSEAKSFALSKTAHDWTLWLDADERVLAETAEEISRIVAANEQRPVAFKIARRAYFLGKWIRHCGWYPGYVVRLFRKSKARFSDSKVHEYLHVDGEIGILKNDLIHYTDHDLDHYFTKFNRYTSLAAEQLLDANRGAGVADLALRPLVVFLKMFIFRLGFLDGMQGFILSRLSALYVFTKYAKRWDLERHKDLAPGK